MKKTFIAIIIILALGALIYIFYPKAIQNVFAPTDTELPEGISMDDLDSEPSDTSQIDPPSLELDSGPSDTSDENSQNTTTTDQQTNSSRADIEVVATDLNVPWDIAFISENDFLVSEREGNLLRFTDGNKSTIAVPNVKEKGEGGLLGITLHPDFNRNKYVYLYKTSTLDDKSVNQVDRYTLTGTQLTNETSIINEIPGAIFHNGGRIAFGPDDKLYIATGDATKKSSSQDKASLAGKLLRLNDDGSIPGDNPFGTAVWSYGHRNAQGLAWTPDGLLWSTEHGPSKASPNSGQDEINLIEKGGNYGWPTVQGDGTGEGFIPPAIHSGVDDTWAPASAVWWDNSVFFGGLRGQALYEAKIEGEVVTEVLLHFKEDYGRLRTIVLGPDGYFYLTTSNTDGRGDASDDNDRIIRINPEIFRQ